MGAIAAVFESHPSTGRIILPDDRYFGIRSLIDETDIGSRFDFAAVDMRDLDAVRAAVTSKRTGLVWVETPSNPMIRVVDISAICKIAHDAGAFAVVDSTWATPVLQRPLELGADAVMHSATKYIGGHSDLMAGIVVVPQASPLEHPLRMVQLAGITGAADIAGPHACSLRRRPESRRGLGVSSARRESALSRPAR